MAVNTNDRRTDVLPARCDGNALDGHVPVLDGLRGVAILMVLFCHAASINPKLYGTDRLPTFLHVVQKVAGYCWTGVDLFFVLSGFLITGILIKTRVNTGYFRNFYARRVLRIFPLYYLAITLFLFVIPLLFVDFNEQYYRYIRYSKAIYYFYLQNMLVNSTPSVPQILMAPLWSLAVEEHYYLVWPVLVYLLRKQRLIHVCLALTAVAVLLRLYLINTVSSSEHEILYRWTVTRMDSLLIGSLLAIIVTMDRWRMFLAQWRTRLFVCAAAALLAVIYCNERSLDGTVMTSVGFTVIALFFASLLSAVTGMEKTRWPVRLFDNGVLRSVGKYSYAMYIVHVVVNSLVSTHVVLRFVPSPSARLLLLFPLTTIITYAIAWCSWHLFEKHFLSMKRYFVHKRVEPVAG
jgi:peptidoglycan/LPS O-acetylase OafA/YrhL